MEYYRIIECFLSMNVIHWMGKKIDFSKKKILVFLKYTKKDETSGLLYFCIALYPLESVRLNTVFEGYP